ncbi:S9 family peptidase [Halosquirtibacter xylanolyticus]|uniref:S9 family peptidase n=1 Tax=Halosquirtibacter xylanolyticus TaxID=3374599 RepID=UPI003749B83B|nr:S9 family peptidase [Prolixibacteraceae bacterium]
MKRLLFSVLAILMISSPLLAEKISFEDVISKRTFSAERIYGIRSMKDGLHYTTLEKEGTQIVKYNYKTGKKVSVLLDITGIEDTPIKHFSDYQFSDTESKVMLTTEVKPIYRHSFTAEYYVYNFVTKKLQALSKNGAQQLATFSPDGNRIAFVRKNNLFVSTLYFGTEKQITKDGEFNKIINGAPDWVYEEEFAFSRAFEWSPDSKKLAYMKFNEAHVRTFSFPMYKGSHPSYEANKLYPGEYTYKYPKAGEENAHVSVHVYDIKKRNTIKVDVGEEVDQYIPRIRWTYSGSDLGVIRLNRRQDKLELMLANPFSGDTRVIYTDKNSRYIDESTYDYLTFLPNDKEFVVGSEKDGYMHLYLYSKLGGLVRKLTPGDYDVTEYYGYDTKRKVFYYQAAKKSAMQREVYATLYSGKKTYAIASKTGTNNAIFSSNYTYFIHTFTDLNTPVITSLKDRKGKTLRTLEANKALNEKMANYEMPTKEFFSFKNSEGISLNGYMIKPSNFDPNHKYPVLMTQYSGPNSQQVLDVFRVSWYDYMAEKGYIVACVDPRGTGARGEEFRKCTYMDLGHLESDDQIDAGKYLGSLDYVDQKNIAIWGWSYGGFMSTLCLSKGADVFKAAIAVAPVTNWRFYDSVYTERYMRKPQENAEGYDKNSPIYWAPKIKGKYLLVHGTADDNVHYQNTAELAEVLVQAGVPFQMMSYTNRNHGIYGGKTRRHLYKMFTSFLDDNLK